MKRTDKLILALLITSILSVLILTAYRFLYQGNYDFIVEASCDPATQTCFTRDCSEEDSCPPNGLENYRTFTIAAGDFSQCSDNSCLAECSAGLISCEELKCGESEEDVCRGPGFIPTVEKVEEAEEVESNEPGT